MSFSQQLPPTLKRFLPRDLINAKIVETKATCGTCAMAPGKTRGKTHYDPHLKCCTFYPFTPNFAVGDILENNALGASAVKEIITQKQFSLPIGLVAPPGYQLKFNSRGANDFGNRAELLCPHFNRKTEGCNIWQQRGSVCASFICKSSYQQKGIRFWEALGRYLHYVEMALMEEILANLDFSPRQVSDLTVLVDIKNSGEESLFKLKMTPQKYKQFWNHYLDEISFYKKCYQMAKKMNRSDLKLVMGQMGSKLEGEVLMSLDSLQIK